MAGNNRDDLEVGTARRIYAVAAALCLVAPALAPIAINRVVLSYVLLAGAPMSLMAWLLATIHAQQRLTGGIHRVAALAWTAGAALMLVPVGIWWPLAYSHSTVVALRTAVIALAAVLFAVLAVRAWRRSSLQPILLAVAFGAIALFFGDRAARYWSVGGDGVESLASVAEALADFFVDAAVTCVFVLPIVAVHRFRNGRVEPHNFTSTNS